MMQQKHKDQPGDLMYALDIGTRNVVGLLLRHADDKTHIIDFELVTHPDRAMYDGQIHDIEKVSRTVGRVTQALEERAGIKLHKVAIAAAGRALKTDRVHLEKAIDSAEQITKNLLDAIEMEAIQTAQMRLESQQEKTEPKYYCVGYSVMQYTLDGAMILNPVGHRGDTLGLELIATFLPHIVVDSLYTVVERVGLEVLSMTLEPIAAIQVAIPQKFRLLNLALIDVGAGTSDIALTRGGSVFSYGMVATAGDEITEALANEYLLDFETAEKVKIALSSQETVTFKDIVGIPHTLEREVILTALEPTIKRLTKLIADKVIENNEKAPSAVFCIGGGCQVPSFTDHLSDALGIPRERTVIKGVESLDGFEHHCDFAGGPENITPVGIGYAAFKDQEQDFINVTLNDKTLRLLNARPLTVSDALVRVGYPARRLLPEKGKGLKVLVMGKEKRFQGESGIPAQILLNGVPVGLDHFIKHKDLIKVEPAIKGTDAEVTLGELHEVQRVIVLNRKPLSLLKQVTVNGEAVSDFERRLVNGDAIHCDYVTTLGELIQKHGLPTDLDYVRATEVLTEDSVLDIQDTLSTVKRAEKREAEQRPGQKPVMVKMEKDVATRDFKVLVNGEWVTLRGDKDSYIFIDIFDYYLFDRSVPKGILKLLRNGHKAAFHEDLKDGDVIEIGWEV